MGSFGSFAHQMLELGKDLLDGVQVGAVGRQEQQARVNAPDCVADSGTPVDGEIVHDGDIACKECGDEALLDLIEEAITVDWLTQDTRCVDPVAA